MPVTHKYFPIPEEIKGKKVIPVCCEENPPADAGCSDCCYDAWKKQLNDVNQDYEKAVEAADILQKRITFTTDRRNRFKKWVDEINATDELFKDLCLQLDVIITHTQKIWFNTCQANEAVKRLFWMIRKFFLEIDYLKCRYDELWTCISRSSDLSLKEDKGLITCLKSYSEKLDVVIKAREELIKQVVEAVKFAQLLRNNMNTACCLPSTYYDNCNEPEQGKKVCENKPDTIPENYVYGFKSVICEWYFSFGCNVECISNVNNLPKPQPPAPTDDSNAFDSCTEDCELIPQFKMPICNDYYYRKCIAGWITEDENNLKAWLGQLGNLNKEKEGLLACKASLTKAIEEADPKLRCK